MTGWKVKRGNDEFDAPDADTLLVWAINGRVLPSDYVFNPILNQWMYAKDLAEVADVFKTRDATASANHLNALGLLLGIGGLFVDLFVPLIGNVMIVAGIILAIMYYIKRPTTIIAARTPEVIKPSKRIARPLPESTSGKRAISPARIAGYIIAGTATLVTTIWIGWKLSGADAQNREFTQSAMTPAQSDVHSPASLTASTTLSQPPAFDSASFVATAKDSPSATSARRADGPPTGYRATESTSRGSFVAQVFIDPSSKTYFREDCTKPPRATRVAKTVALAEGYRPSPDCYAVK